MLFADAGPRRRGTVYVLGGVVFVAALLGSFVVWRWLGADSESGGTAEVATEAVEQGTPVTTISPSVSAVGVPVPTSGLNGTGSEDLREGAMIDGRAVVVGIVTEVGDDQDQEYGLWWSDDGAQWTRVALDDDPDGLQGLTAVRQAGAGLVAVGTSEREVDAAATVFESSDGKTWRRIPYDAVVFDGVGDQVPSGAVQVGDVTLVIGWETTGDDGGSDAVVWRRKGTTARFERIDSELFQGPLSARPYAVLAVDDRVVVMVGRESSPGRSALAVWRSEDQGRTWSRVGSSAFEVDGYGELSAIEWKGDRLVAVGQREVDGGVDAISAISDDGGRSWHLGVVEDGPGDQAPWTMTAVGDELIAFGHASSPSCDCLDGAVWLSDDGEAWTRLEDPEGSLVANGSEELIAVLRAGEGDAFVVGRIGTAETSHRPIVVGLTP